jgi:hypothetical protein
MCTPLPLVAWHQFASQATLCNRRLAAVFYVFLEKN